MNKFQKYPSTPQFRDIIKTVRAHADYHEVPYPTIEFVGTVKLHGTNGGIGYNPVTKEVWFQSRERVLDIVQDNAGFCAWGHRRKDELICHFEEIVSAFDITSGLLYLYGEWAGTGIQKNVGISTQPKRFYPFALMHRTDIDDENSLREISNHFGLPTFNNGDDIVPIENFKTHHITIDFKDPQSVQNQLVALTLDVEGNCPVAASYGVENECGEGIVWKSKTPMENGMHLRYKVKGTLHSLSKVKTLSEISATKVAHKESIKEFVEYAVTENRLEQGISYLKEMHHELSVKSTGHFLKWIVSDVIKEESDVMAASYFDAKDVNGEVSKKAKTWFFEFLEKDLSLA